MREIKFRCWNPRDKMMGDDPFTLHDAILQEIGDPWLPEDEVNGNVYLQYTGLHDKHKKEIYEKDIIEDCLGFRHLVRWINEEIWYRSSCLTGEKHSPMRIGPGFVMGDCTFDLEENMEIIGNVFENPELLENKE